MPLKPPFELFMARRYLASRRKPLFVPFLLKITRGAVALGVFALIVVLSIMNGFEKDFRQRILGFKAPLSVVGMDISAEDLKVVSGSIDRVVPFVEGEAIVESEDGNSLGIRVRGLGEAPSEQRLGVLDENDEFSEDSLLIGQELAYTLGVGLGLPEPLKLIFPLGDIGPTGDLVPNVRHLTLTGTFRSGFYDFDRQYVLTSVSEAQKLFGREARQGYEIWLHSMNDAELVKKNLLKKFPDLKVKSWKDENPKLFAAMKLEKIGMFLLLGMILLIASLNIFGLTSLAVTDKRKDMAILRTVGISAGGLRRLFLLQAFGMGFYGAVIGGVVGLVTVVLLQVYPLPLPNTYYLESLPVFLDKSDVFWIVVLIPVLTTLAALYPAIHASRQTPIEGLRYE